MTARDHPGFAKLVDPLDGFAADLLALSNRRLEWLPVRGTGAHKRALVVAAECLLAAEENPRIVVVTHNDSSVDAWGHSWTWTGDKRLSSYGLTTGPPPEGANVLITSRGHAAANQDAYLRRPIDLLVVDRGLTNPEGGIPGLLADARRVWRVISNEDVDVELLGPAGRAWLGLDPVPFAPLARSRPSSLAERSRTLPALASI